MTTPVGTSGRPKSEFTIARLLQFTRQCDTTTLIKNDFSRSLFPLRRRPFYRINNHTLIDTNCKEKHWNGEQAFYALSDILYDSLCRKIFNPAAYDILHTSLFYATYGFLIACEYETKRLGIYNFSCLSRRGAICLQRRSNDRSTGAERKTVTFYFSFSTFLLFIYTRLLCIMCVNFLFVLLLFVHVSFHRVFVDCASIIARE